MEPFEGLRGQAFGTVGTGSSIGWTVLFATKKPLLSAINHLRWSDPGPGRFAGESPEKSNNLDGLTAASDLVSG
jgi:hypothetical protein